MGTKTLTWSLDPPMPIPTYDLSLVSLGKHVIVLLGGYTDTNPFIGFYDTQDRVWKTLKIKTKLAASHIAVLLDRNQLILCGNRGHRLYFEKINLPTKLSLKGQIILLRSLFRKNRASLNERFITNSNWCCALRSVFFFDFPEEMFRLICSFL